MVQSKLIKCILKAFVYSKLSNTAEIKLLLLAPSAFVNHQVIHCYPKSNYVKAEVQLKQIALRIYCEVCHKSSLKS